MTHEEVIAQLESLKRNAEDNARSDVGEQMRLDDIEALEYALEKLKEDKQ